MNLWIYRNSLPQSSSSSFKEAFRLVVAILTMKDFQVQVHLQIKGQAWKNSSTSSVSKFPSLGLSKSASKTR